ncbi:MAG: M48 family metalloprotease, partial [Moorea sp. SIO3C2]|nr:M48 family metalloprotease [Moorena sp. SIO3C2]
MKALSKSEVDAIVAHEISHLKLHLDDDSFLSDFLSLPVSLFLTGTFLGMLLDGFIALLHSLAGQGSWLFVVAICIILGAMFLMVQHHASQESQEHEYQADSGASQLVEDPMPMITGMVKMTELSQYPMEWAKWSEGWMTHPSTQKRIRALCKQYRVSTKEVNTLLRQNTPPAKRYSIPGSLTSSIFTTPLKSRITQTLYWAFTCCFTLLPAILVWSMTHFSLNDWRWQIYLAGILSCLIISWFINCFVGTL